jgi:hypothetical protein
MGKKCIPGFFCIGNMTLFFIFFLFLCVLYLYLRLNDLGNKSLKNNDVQNQSLKPVIVMNPIPPPVIYQNPPINTLTNLYAPPLRNDNYVNGILPIATQPFDQNYRQIGILTRQNGSAEILPLMGRRKMTSRDKWQYYTMTGNNIQMKLPLSVNGKSCTGEYGCNEIFNNDTVYVEGFKDVFVATVYENNTFTYMP